MACFLEKDIKSKREEEKIMFSSVERRKVFQYLSQ
jgi:hypothetical protein